MSPKLNVMELPIRKIQIAGQTVYGKFDSSTNTLYYLDEEGNLTGETTRVQLGSAAARAEASGEEVLEGKVKRPAPKFHTGCFLAGMGTVLGIMFLWFLYLYLSYEGIL